MTRCPLSSVYKGRGRQNLPQSSKQQASKGLQRPTQSRVTVIGQTGVLEQKTRPYNPWRQKGGAGHLCTFTTYLTGPSYSNILPFNPTGEEGQPVLLLSDAETKVGVGCIPPRTPRGWLQPQSSALEGTGPGGSLHRVTDRKTPAPSLPGPDLPRSEGCLSVLAVPEFWKLLGPAPRGLGTWMGLAPRTRGVRGARRSPEPSNTRGSPPRPPPPSSLPSWQTTLFTYKGRSHPASVSPLNNTERGPKAWPD